MCERKNCSGSGRIVIGAVVIIVAIHRRSDAEMVQMGILDPRLAILDETDSGLDIDALKTVGAGINAIMRAPDKAVLLITHYQRLLDYVRPDFVHVLSGGRIVRTGGPELAHALEREGYDAVMAA